MAIEYSKFSLSYHDAFEYYCFKNCYLQILRYYGIRSPEYYIETNLDWKLIRSDKQPFGYEFQTGDRYSGLVSPCSEKVRLQTAGNNKPATIWEKNLQCLNQKLPVTVAVDVFYLPYTPYFQKKHSFHSLIICGVHTDKADILDWYTPWFYQGQISMELLDKARSSTNSGSGLLGTFAIEYAWAIIEKEEWQEYRKGDLVEITVSDLLSSYYGGIENAAMSTGRKALTTLMRFILKMEEESKRRRLFLEDLYYQLYFVVTRKRLLQWYLEMVESDFRTVIWSHALALLAQTRKSWQNLLHLIMKCSIDDTPDNYDTIIFQLNKCILQEDEFYYELFRMKSTLVT